MEGTWLQNNYLVHEREESELLIKKRIFCGQSWFFKHSCFGHFKVICASYKKNVWKKEFSSFFNKIKAKKKTMIAEGDAILNQRCIQDSQKT